MAVINQTLAKEFFPDRDPVGLTFETDPEDAAGPVEIVGIAADTRYADLRSPTPATFYLAYKQSHPGRAIIQIQTAAAPAGVLAEVRAAVASLDRDLPLIDVRTMREQVASTLTSESIFARLTSGFGLFALLLVSIGVYGIMAYTVARRTGEIGIRMALGARSGQVASMILREVSWMALAGIALGIGAALGIGHLVASMLYGIGPFDPATVIGVAGLLLLISFAAGFGPARRAAQIDPIRALRQE